MKYAKCKKCLRLCKVCINNDFTNLKFLNYIKSY